MELTRTISTESKRTLLLIITLVVSISFVSILALTLLHNTAIEEKKEELQGMVKRQALLIEAIAQFDKDHAESYSTSAMEATLSQIRKAFLSFTPTSKTAQFILGRREGNSIIIVARSGNIPGKNPPTRLLVKGKGFGDPMRLALNQKSGMLMVPKSYTGKPALAAYGPIPFLGLGIVAREDLSEIRAPFIRTGSIVLLIAGLVAIIASMLFLKVTNPMIRQLHESRDDLKLSEKLLKRSQKIAKVGSWHLDLTSNRLYWSDEVYRIFGMDPSEFGASYEAFVACIHPDDREMVNLAYETSVKNKQAYDIVHRIQRPDGAVRIVREKSEEVTDSSGTVVASMGMVHDITDQAEAEEKLKESEQQYRRLLENLGPRLFLYTHDTDCVFTYVSPSIKEVLGYTEEEFLAYFEIYHTESPINDEVVERTQKAIAGERQPPYQVEVFCKDGSICRLEVVESPVFDDQGIVTGVEGIAQDISDRIVAEQGLKLTQFATDRAGDAIFWMGPDLRFIYVNDKACDYLGYSREELLQLGISDINRDFPSEKCEPAWQKIKQEKSFTLEMNHLHKDGTLIPVEITTNYVNYDGREYNMAIVRDITERKAAELALMEQTLRNQLILENTHDGFIILAIDGRLREANNAYCRLVKYDRSTLLGMSIADLSTLKSPEEIKKIIKKIMEHGHNRFEASHRCSDGSFVDLDIIATLASIGEDQFIFSFCRDITERKMREQKRLLEVKAQRDTLVREIHHRIKNHLQGIINLLRNQITDKPEIAEAMEPAIGQVDSIALIHGLQSRVNGGRIELASLLDAICSAVNNLTSAGIQLDTSRLVCNIIVRQADAVPIALILNELLQNAVKHTPEELNTPEVQAKLFVEDDEVTLRLTNPCATPLPEGFDIKLGLGLGTGLTLARDLLPHQGAKLSISGDDAQVTTELVLESPVVTLEG